MLYADLSRLLPVNDVECTLAVVDEDSMGIPTYLYVTLAQIAEAEGFWAAT